ncbi:hypothetical protein EVG20_g11304, partial [Dentipellis fragilis]
PRTRWFLQPDDTRLSVGDGADLRAAAVQDTASWLNQTMVQVSCRAPFDLLPRLLSPMRSIHVRPASRAAARHPANTSANLDEIGEKGRPITQCDHCAELRETRQDVGREGQGTRGWRNPERWVIYGASVKAGPSDSAAPIPATVDCRPLAPHARNTLPDFHCPLHPPSHNAGVRSSPGFNFFNHYGCTYEGHFYSREQLIFASNQQSHISQRLNQQQISSRCVRRPSEPLLTRYHSSALQNISLAGAASF